MIGLGLGRRAASRGWIAQSIFWSDGKILDGRLKDILGRTEVEPSLVDSNCLTMAVDDTITFASLAGWSLVSNLGTAVVEINGNNILCTTAGSLYKLILSDGTNQHNYPLAEGAYTIAHDTYSIPVHGVITCASLVWSIQSEYHKNIEGYRDRSHIDKYEQSVFLGAGVPTGWVNVWGVCTITTNNNIVRVTTPAGGVSNAYKFNVSRAATVTTGQKIRGTLRVRASKAMVIEVRGGSENSAIINVTTEWQTLTSTTSTGTSSTAYLGISSREIGGDLWFEFDYVFIEQLVSATYRVPKRDGYDLDSYGRELDIIGQGYFIDAETKLKFPDNATYQALDENLHLEFIYDKDGNLRELSYSDLYENVHSLDCAHNQKTEGRLTRMILVNHQDFTRSQFRGFIRALGKNDYVYNKITRGAVVYFNLASIFEDTELRDNSKDYLSSKGITLQRQMQKKGDSFTSANFQVVKDWLAAGQSTFSVKIADYGCTSFELYPDEELLYADEVASGDLIIIDTPSSGRGAYVKIDFPDFITEGTLITTTKQNGTVILDNAAIYGYANVCWIPAGQSGVPSELEEVPLSLAQAAAVDKRLRFRSWAADDLFSTSFTNADQINVYVLQNTKYMNGVSSIGMSAYYKHARYAYESFDPVARNMGWLEGHPGELVGASIASPALWAAGMLFGSSGGVLSAYKSLLFSNQNDPSKWCGCMGHAIWRDETYNEIISNRFPAVADKNQIMEADFLTAGIVDIGDLMAVVEACENNGILFLGAIDLIKNMQFNDYRESDFFKE